MRQVHPGTYILLDVLLCSIAEYFYELCRMFVRANYVNIYLQGMRDRSMRSGTELAREIKLSDWSMAGNLSNRSSGVQISRDICTRLKRHLYSAKCSWIRTLTCLIRTPSSTCFGYVHVKRANHVGILVGN